MSAARSDDGTAIMCAMNTTSSRVILATEGFAARPELAVHAEEKALKLLRHEHPRVLRLRLNVKLAKPRDGQPHFIARAAAEHEGADNIAHAVGIRPEAAINAVMDKLERILSASAGARKHWLHHPHGVDLPCVLPKAG
jgi:hypothetical protein